MMNLSDMTGPAFAALARLRPVILLPLGSHEDHGPYLPMGDYATAAVLAGRIAAAAGVPCVAAPTLPFGVADYFGASPGGMAISPAAFKAVLGDLLGCLLRHGLNRIVILNGHGGNVPVIHEVTLAIRRETGVIIPSLYLWQLARLLMARRGSQAFGHGAEPLLSLSLALRPDDVDPAAVAEPIAATVLGLPVNDFGSISFEGLPVAVPAEFDAVPNNAQAAALATASAALGATVADELVAMAVRFVRYVAMAVS